jgi:hypothetical protein
MNKKISTNVWIVIAVVSAVIVILAIWVALAPPIQTPTDTGMTTPNIPTGSIQNQPQASVADAKQKACLNSGGAISTAICCGQTQDFPNNCAIGACGCSPENSHQVKICQCGEGKCFDGNSCVQTSQSGSGNTGEPSSPGGQKQCTMEAKLCPDGTSVGKTGPNCEFAPCP